MDKQKLAQLRAIRAAERSASGLPNLATTAFPNMKLRESKLQHILDLTTPPARDFGKSVGEAPREEVEQRDIEVLRTGWGTKMGGRHTTWKRRFFVLRNRVVDDELDEDYDGVTHLLMYYKRERHAKSGKPAGMIPIDPSEVRISVLPIFRKHTRVLMIKTPKRTYYVKTADSVEDWSKGLAELVTPENSAELRRSTLGDRPKFISSRQSRILSDNPDDHDDCQDHSEDAVSMKDVQIVEDSTVPEKKDIKHVDDSTIHVSANKPVGVSGEFLAQLALKVRSHDNFVKCKTNGHGKRSYISRFFRSWSDDIDDLTIYEMCEQFIRKESLPGKAYCDSSGADQTYTGVATVYVSYSPMGRALTLLDQLAEYGRKTPETYFHIPFCMQDLNADETAEQYLSEIPGVVASINRTMLYLPVEEDFYLFSSQAACLYEMYCTLKSRAYMFALPTSELAQSLQIAMARDEGQFSKSDVKISLKNLNCENKKCSSTEKGQAFLKALEKISVNSEGAADSEQFIQNGLWDAILAVLESVATSKIRALSNSADRNQALLTTQFCSDVGVLLASDHQPVAALNMYQNIVSQLESYRTNMEPPSTRERVSTWDPISFRIADTHHRIADVLRTQGELDDALESMAKVRKLTELTFGELHPESIKAGGNVAELLYERGDLAAALEKYRVTMEEAKAVLLESDIDVAWYHAGAGQVLKALRENDGALLEFRAALGILETMHPQGRMELANLHSRIGSLLMRKNKFEDAQQEYETALSLIQREKGSTHKDSVDCLENIALAMKFNDNEEGVIAVQAKARAIREGKAADAVSQLDTFTARSSMSSDRSKYKIRHESELGSDVAEMNGDGWLGLGVSTQFLEDMLLRVSSLEDLHQEKGLEELTTSEICDLYVSPNSPTQRPYCMSVGGAFLDGLIGTATVFVSHSHECSFVQLLTELIKYGKSNPKCYFWIDFIMLNQVPPTGDTSMLHEEFFGRQFRDTIEAIGHTILVLDSWKTAAPVSRTWCLFETYITLMSSTTNLTILEPQAAKLYLREQVLADPNEVVKRFSDNVDIANSTSFFKDDKENILRQIENSGWVSGGVGASNVRLNETLKTWKLGELNDLVELECSHDSSELSDGEKAESAKFLGNAGSIFSMHENFDSAIMACQQSIDIVVATKQDVKTVTEAHNNIGLAFRAAGQLQKALEAFKQALETSEKETSTNEEIQCLRSSTRNNIAVTLASDGKLSEAIDLMEKVISDRKELYGSQSLEVASAYENLANMLCDNHDPRAIEAHKEVVAIRSVVLGASHPDTGRAEYELAKAYKSLGQPIPAIIFLEKAHKIFLQALGPHSSETLYSQVDLKQWVKEDKEKRLLDLRSDFVQADAQNLKEEALALMDDLMEDS